MQGLQEEDNSRRQEESSDDARETAAQQSQRRFRDAEALHGLQPEPAAAQSGDPAKRNKLHRVSAGAAAGRAKRQLLPPAGALRRGVGLLQPPLQLLRQHGEAGDS